MDNMEVIISNQRAFVQATISKKFADDQELFKLNGGAAGAYENYHEGDVVQNIDQYHEALTNHCRGLADDIRIAMHNQQMEDIIK